MDSIITLFFSIEVVLFSGNLAATSLLWKAMAMIIANKRVNENTICNEDSADIHWTNIYNWENNDFKYWI